MFLVPNIDDDFVVPSHSEVNYNACASKNRLLKIDHAWHALAYLEDHYTEEIPLAELARVAGVSPRHLDRVFAQAFHFTPRAYIARLRMARARALLRTDRPITEIAFDCGYADSNYFSQVFRRHTGMSPQQYRRETMK